jgi:AraC-like DNA-binding protein
MAAGIVPSIALSGADQLIVELGCDAARIAADSGLPSSTFTDPDLPVPISAAADFLELSAIQCRCPEFGLRLADKQDLSVLGPLFVLMSLAATVREALGLMCKHMRLHSSGLIITARSDPEGMALDYGAAYREAELDRQGMELGIALVTKFVRGFQPVGWVPHYVQFRHGPPAQLRLHRQLLGPNVFFNQDRVSVCIDREALSAPVHNASPDTRSFTSRLLRRSGSMRGQGIVQRTEATVRALLPFSRDCSVGTVASILATSTRSLQRGLAENGATFETIRDSVRADLAAKYLVQSTMSVAEIGDVLGYSQPSAFARSFRRWRDTTPLKYRQAWFAKHRA